MSIYFQILFAVIAIVVTMSTIGAFVLVLAMDDVYGECNWTWKQARKYVSPKA